MLRNVVVALILMFLVFMALAAFGGAGLGPVELGLYLLLTAAVVAIVAWRSREATRR